MKLNCFYKLFKFIFPCFLSNDYAYTPIHLAKKDIEIEQLLSNSEMPETRFYPHADPELSCLEMTPLESINEDYDVNTSSNYSSSDDDEHLFHSCLDSSNISVTNSIDFFNQSPSSFLQ